MWAADFRGAARLCAFHVPDAERFRRTGAHHLGALVALPIDAVVELQRITALNELCHAKRALTLRYLKALPGRPFELLPLWD